MKPGIPPGAPPSLGRGLTVLAGHELYLGQAEGQQAWMQEVESPEGVLRIYGGRNPQGS